MEGKATKGVMVSLTSPNGPEFEDAFNEWYDTVHVPDILGTGLFEKALRYKAAVADVPQYLAVYEISSDDVGGTFKQLLSEVAKLRDAGRMFADRSSFMLAPMKTRRMFNFRDPKAGGITGLLAMGSNPKTPGTDDAFNEWYDNVHMEDINNTGMYTVCHRFQTVDPTDGQIRYINMYETDLDDVSVALTGLDNFRPDWIERGRLYADRDFLLRGAYKLMSVSARD